MQSALPRFCRKRTATIYIAVLGVAMIVTIMGFCALQIARLNLRAAQDRQHHNEARFLAQSAIEFALGRISYDPLWRITYASGEAEPTPAKSLGNGQFTFKLIDPTDSDLTDDANDPVDIIGIGEVHNAVFVYKVTASTSSSSNSVGPSLLKELTSGSNIKEFDVKPNSWLCQYFKPTLPSNATGWRVTRVEVLARSNGANSETTTFKLYVPNSDKTPSNVSVAQADLPENQLSASFAWKSVDVGGNYTRLPSEGLCLALETYEADESMTLRIQEGALSDPNSALTRGNPNWQASVPNDAMLYRIHGVYTTAGSTGEFAIHPGSWEQMSAD